MFHLVVNNPSLHIFVYVFFVTQIFIQIKSLMSGQKLQWIQPIGLAYEFRRKKKQGLLSESVGLPLK